MDKNNLRTWLEISKSAIDSNIENLKKIVGDKILAPVIKSNAYGHGLIEVAKICEENKNISWMCVANAEEALILRQNGIKKNILLLSYIGNHAEELISKNVSLIAYDIEEIKILNQIGKKLNKQVNLHIKIDTGLSRLGILPEDAANFISQIKFENKNLGCLNFDHINIEGIWTHLAESASEDREFTNLQASRFEKVIKDLETINIKIPYIHSCSTAGMITADLKYNNFYRPGIGLYGYFPSEYIKNLILEKYPDFELTPCISWKTKICNIREIETGTFVGYNRTFCAKRKTKLALIPVGYYDGYDRRLSNIGKIIINGQVAKIAGRLCMNVMMLDITDCKNIKIGDEAILLGNSPEINASNIADSVEMNPRDLTSKINLEIPRITVE